MRGRTDPRRIRKFAKSRPTRAISPGLRSPGTLANGTCAVTSATVIFPPVKLREKFGLARKYETGLVHPFLGNRAGNNRLNLSRSCKTDRFLQSVEGVLRRGAFRTPGRKCVRCPDNPVANVRRKTAAIQRGTDDLRPDTGRIATGDPDIHRT